MISLPLLDDVKAAGLTPIELRDLIAKVYREVQLPLTIAR
jgi:protein involved in polysaccharide export with SLBB domain